MPNGANRKNYLFGPTDSTRSIDITFLFYVQVKCGQSRLFIIEIKSLLLCNVFEWMEAIKLSYNQTVKTTSIPNLRSIGPIVLRS